MARIPNIVHFVFGLREQSETFHLMYYLAIESCRIRQQPEAIFFYYHHLPLGMYWDLIRPHLTLVRVSPVSELEGVVYDEQLVPARYRYAHHADFIRLDALIEHGGIYADIDTLFLAPLAAYLFEHAFVIGRESNVKDELTGEIRPSLCNALMLAEPGAPFAKEWRQRMAGAMNGTWSNHSCFLPQELSVEMPESVHIEPPQSFLGVPCSREGLSTLLDEGSEGPDLTDSYSIHLWAHLWWEQERTDFSNVSGEQLKLINLKQGNSALCRMVRELLPALEIDDLPAQ